MWTCVSLLAVILSVCWRKVAFWLGAFIFVWLYAVPIADIANGAMPYLAGENTDFYNAFGPPTVAFGAAVGALGGIAALVGYWVQRRLYGDYALSGAAYVILGGVVAVMAVLMSVGF